MLSGIVTNVISIECVPIDLILSSNVRNHAAKYAYLIDSSSMPWVSSHRTDRTRDDEAYCAAHLPRVVSLSSWKVFVVNVWETRVKKTHYLSNPIWLSGDCGMHMSSLLSRSDATWQRRCRINAYMSFSFSEGPDRKRHLPMSCHRYSNSV